MGFDVRERRARRQDRLRVRRRLAGEWGEDLVVGGMSPGEGPAPGGGGGAGFQGWTWRVGANSQARSRGERGWSLGRDEA